MATKSGFTFKQALSRGLDVRFMAAAGMLSDASVIHKFGENPAVGAAAETVWDVGGVYPWQAHGTGTSMVLASTDANDVSGIGTLTLTGQPLDTETVIIAGKTYTFQTVLTNVDGNVLIGASASASIDNLIAAINLSAGAGTTYALDMTENDSSTTAYVGAGDTMSLYDNTASAIATTETLTNGSWGAANTVNGTGARFCTVSYIKTDDTQVTENLAMHGVEDQLIATDIYLPYRMAILPGSDGENAAGSGGTAAGTITIKDGATVYAQIIIGNNQTLMAVFHIPAGTVGYLITGDTTVGEGKEVSTKYFTRVDKGVFAVNHSLQLFENTYRYDFTLPIPIPAGTDLDVRSVDAALAPIVTASFDIILVDI